MTANRLVRSASQVSAGYVVTCRDGQVRHVERFPTLYAADSWATGCFGCPCGRYVHTIEYRRTFSDGTVLATVVDSDVEREMEDRINTVLDEPGEGEVHPSEWSDDGWFEDPA